MTTEQSCLVGAVPALGMMMTMRRVCVWMLLTGSLLTSAWSADVEISDPHLDTAVRQLLKRKQIDKLDPAKKLTEEDLATIYLFDASKKEITNLAGLDKCKNLAQLKLAGNRIADITPLAACVNLQSLDLAQNEIADVTPLAKLVKLQYLQLDGNRVTSVEPLASLKALTAVYLSRNQLTDVTPLADIPKLTSLYLGDNQLTDVAPLSKLRWLSSLDLRGNRIENVAPLATLTELRYTFLDRNPLTDITPLLAAAEKDAAGEKRFAPYWHLSLIGLSLSPESQAAVGKLKTLGVRVKVE
jgi:internalin A